MVSTFKEVRKLGSAKDLLAPKRELVLPPGISLDPNDPRDPALIGYDRQQYQGLAAITQETQNLDYSSSGSDAVDLSRDRIITGIMLVADPYQHDVTTAVIVAVQDAVDKVISSLQLQGKLTYFSLSSTLSYLRALSAMNKSVYGSNLAHADLATAVGADNPSRQAWYIPFGALNDFDPFDITAGIPAEDETTLQLAATFGANQIIATVAANGTVDAATNIYVVSYGVQGMSAEYRSRLPVPDFRHDHIQAPTAESTFSLQVGRYLKRTTILNLGVLAANNEPRNDSNVTNATVRFKRPTDTRLFSRIRWHVFKSLNSAWFRLPAVDRNGTAAIITEPMTGVTVIDWRRLTKNPYGLNLYPFQNGDVELTLEMGTTTGSIHLYNEYYALPDPTVAENWPAFRPQ